MLKYFSFDFIPLLHYNIVPVSIYLTIMLLVTFMNAILLKRKKHNAVKYYSIYRLGSKISTHGSTHILQDSIAFAYNCK